MRRACSFVVAAMAAVFSASCSGKNTSSESPPTISRFTATPQTITRGASSVLSWDCSGAASMWIDPEVGPVDGSTWSVSPTATTTYTLTARNENGTATAQTTVVVLGAQCTENLICQPDNSCAVGATACTSPDATPTCNVTGNKVDGTPCGNAGVCSAGSCIAACEANKSCDTGNVCTVGTTACAHVWSSPTCEVAGNRPDGYECAQGRICNQGICEAGCIADLTCQPDDACKVGTTTCSSPAADPECIVVGNKEDGEACGNGRVCSSGTCVDVCREDETCTPSAACKAGATVCATPWAIPACSVTGNLPDGTICGTNQVCSAGSCVRVPTIARVYVPDAVTVVNNAVTLTAVVTVGSGNPSSDVDWQTEGGTVSPPRGPSTTYVAPSVPGKYRVWATSVEDPSKNDFAFVIVKRPPDSWRGVANLPTPRYSMAAVAVNGRVYAIGGIVDNRCCSSTVEVYDPATGLWSSGPAMPTPRADSGAALLNGKIYVVGGASADGNPVGTGEMFDPLTAVWSTLAPLPTPRSGLVAVSANGRIYAIGGQVTMQYYPYLSDVVEEYDPITDTWISRPPLHGLRAFSAGAAWNGMPFVVGGTRWDLMGDRVWSYLSSSEQYNPITYSWSYGPSLPCARTALAVATSPDGKAYAIGGSAQDYTLSSEIDEFDPSTQGWSSRSYMPTARELFAAAYAGDAIYVIGGVNAYSTARVEEYTPSLSAGQVTALVGQKPWGILHDGTNIWVANTGSASVAKLRPSDGAVLGTYPVGSEPRGDMAFDGTYVWVTNTYSHSVSRIRAIDSVNAGTFSVGSYPHGAAFDGANIWVANWSGNSVTKLRASDGYVLGTYPVGLKPRGVASDGTSVWVTTANEITRLRVSDGGRIGSFTPVNDPYGIVFDGTSIWFANRGGNTVTKVRPSDGAHLGTFVVGSAPIGVAAAGSSVWVTSSGTNSVTELRASDGSVMATLKAGESPHGVAFDGARPWVTSHGGSDVRRLY